MAMANWIWSSSVAPATFYAGNGDGTFQPAVPTSISNGLAAGLTTLIDMNGDGILDIAASSGSYSGVQRRDFRISGAWGRHFSVLGHHTQPKYWVLSDGRDRGGF
jgi:hypothetical protein